MKTFLIYGVSRGLGKAMSLSLPALGDKLYGVSRSKPDYLSYHGNIHWISADLAQAKASVAAVKEVIGDERIDYLIYNVGVWEHNAFESNYSFEANSLQEISGMIETNITSCIMALQAFVNNLKLADNAKVILIGSTWGLDNHQGKEIVFSATKFALRGVVHALRENLRPFRIGVSILNLGYLATEYAIDTAIEEVLENTDHSLIPLQDVLSAIRFILSTSSATCVKEINMPAMQDVNV